MKKLVKVVIINNAYKYKFFIQFLKNIASKRYLYNIKDYKVIMDTASLNSGIKYFDFSNSIVMEDSSEEAYYFLSKKKRKEIVIEKPAKGKIIVEFINEDGTLYKCVYNYIEESTLYKKIERNEKITLNGCYIRNFDIRKIKNYTNLKINSLVAIHSFWDGNTDFANGHFKDDVIFEKAVFNGNVTFFSTKFGDGNISFFGANFSCANLIITNAHFGKGILSFEFAVFGQKSLSFMLAHFGYGDVSFFGAKANEIKFTDNNFISHVDLRLEEIDNLIIKNCIIEKTMKCDKCGNNFIEYKVLSFLDTVNLGHIYLDWENNKVFDAINNFRIENEAGKNIGFSYKQKIQQFRMLKENFHNIGYYSDEDLCYRAYMNARVKDNKIFIIKVFDWIGGYGTNPFSIIPAILFIWFAFGFVYWFFFSNMFSLNISGEAAAINNLLDGLYFSGITFLTIGYGEISPNVNEYIPRFLAIAEGFIGLFLMSYFTVAVVRKILR
ncbi:MAG: potassium channel family protein [Eubacteriales bacterium]